jgi:RNA processing factor Prp31
MNNHYNNLMSTDIARLGIQKSFDESQQIKPNELLINDDMLNVSNKRHGFDQTNKVIENLNDEILQLNNKIQSLYIKLNKYDKVVSENNDYIQKIMDLENNSNKNNALIGNLKLEITKLKKIIYEKYNTEMYKMLKNISEKTNIEFNIVHIISQQLNIKVVNKGTINELISGIEKFKEKSKEIELTQ